LNRAIAAVVIVILLAVLFVRRKKGMVNGESSVKGNGLEPAKKETEEGKKKGKK
jgi:hypothetical protein